MLMPPEPHWPDRRILDLLGIEFPILQAPMAGAGGSALAIAVSQAGGLGALPCAMLTADQARTELSTIRQATDRPIHVNFFCHQPPQPDDQRETRWRERLAAYYDDLGLDRKSPVAGASRAPFDDRLCAVVEEFRPEVVSFHFGLPKGLLLQRVRAAGSKILASATTVDEARWLAEAGCDAIIAQGFEAGGHRGMFLTVDVSRQVGTMALVPQVVDAVKVPVVGAGGIADGRAIVAALALGASAVQIGTAYLLCPEATVRPAHREALRQAKDDGTAVTNVFTGRPARGFVTRVVREVGPLSDLAPEFPSAAAAMAPLRSAAEARGSTDFSPMWAGQAAALARESGAADLTRRLAAEGLARLAWLRST
jgi:nitronate monooxygenase